MELKLYQVDAFTQRTFSGNPAAVVPLDEWLPDATMQAIALLCSRLAGLLDLGIALAFRMPFPNTARRRNGPESECSGIRSSSTGFPALGHRRCTRP